jgi:hypothetical protein
MILIAGGYGTVWENRWSKLGARVDDDGRPREVGPIVPTISRIITSATVPCTCGNCPPVDLAEIHRLLESRRAE